MVRLPPRCHLQQCGGVDVVVVLLGSVVLEVVVDEV